MEISFNFLVLLELAAIAVGIVSGLVLIYFGLTVNSANVPLGIAQLSTGLLVWANFVMISGLIIHWPFLFGLGNAFSLIFIPMYFLYVVFYTQRRSWKWYDAFHAIPLVLFVVDYWHIFFMQADEKALVIRQVLDNPLLLTQYTESKKYFGPGFHWEFQTVMFSLYWLAMVVIFVRWLGSQPSLTPVNKTWRNWMITFLAYQFILWSFHFLNLFGVAIFTLQTVNYTSVALWTTITLVIFFFPSIMYGSKLTELKVVTLKVKVNSKAPLSDAEKQKLGEALRTMESNLEDNKHFLIEGYSIHDFARDSRIPVYQIYKALGTFKGLGYVDYINQKRIQYCISKLNQGEWMQYTLEAVATECGFSNRNSFTQAFDKFSGESPSVYRRRLKKLQLS